MRRSKSAYDSRRPQSARESRSSGPTRESYASSRPSCESSRIESSRRSGESGSYVSCAESGGSRSARGPRSDRSVAERADRSSVASGMAESYAESGSRMGEARSRMSAAPSDMGYARSSASDWSYSSSRADEYFDVIGAPRPHMLGYTIKKRPEHGFGRSISGGFCLREVPPPLKNPDYHLAYRAAHPDARYFAEPNQPGPGFRRTGNGNFWRR